MEMILEINKDNVQKFLGVKDDILYEVINASINAQACFMLDNSEKTQKLRILVTGILDGQPMQLSKISGLFSKYKFNKERSRILEIVLKEEMFYVDDTLGLVTHMAKSISVLFYPCASMASAVLIHRMGLTDVSEAGNIKVGSLV